MRAFEVLSWPAVLVVSLQVYRHGQNPKGHDRFRCRDATAFFSSLHL
ncbi:IS1 family transposase [Shigella dysenteriae]